MSRPGEGFVDLMLLLQVIKVYNEDNTSRAVEVPSDITARDVCQLFVLKNHCIDDHSWTLFEHLSHLGIGKIVFFSAQLSSFSENPCDNLNDNMVIIKSPNAQDVFKWKVLLQPAIRGSDPLLEIYISFLFYFSLTVLIIIFAMNHK